MGIHGIAVLLKELVDAVHRVALARICGVKLRTDLLEFLRAQRVSPRCRKRRHTLFRERRVPSRELEDEPLQVGGHENIHRRRHRLVERTLDVIRSLVPEIGENVVLVGRAYERPDGKPHLLGIIACKNVPEIARGNGEVDLVAHFDLIGRHKIAIRREIIADLRRETAEVDGVRRGEQIPLFGEFFLALRRAEDLLDARLTVVEIALDGNHVDVVPLLRAHLELLHFGDAVIGIEHHDLDAVGVLEPFKRSLARIAAGGDEDEDLFLDPAQITALSEKVRKHGERHILERARRAVEEFEHVHAVLHAYEGRGVPALKLRVCLLQCGEQFVLVVFVEVFVQDERGALGVIHPKHRLQFFL